MRVGLPDPSFAIEMPALKLLFSIFTAVAADVLPVWSVLLYAEI